MADYNKSTLIGSLADDPRLAPESFGKNAATITVVVRDFWRDRDGNAMQARDYFKVRLYGQPASYAATYLGKGSQVFICGRLKTEKWTDSVTKLPRSGTVIVVDQMEGLQCLDGNRDLDGQDGSAAPGQHEPGEKIPNEATNSDPGSTKSPAAPSIGQGVDAASPEFENQWGLQPVPF